ncbi:MAG TPA: site-2 protease family protein [Thermoplasmata archaeon]
MNGYLIALVVFIAWVCLVYALNRMKWFQKHNMSLQGPIIMWKTRRGRDLIERLASKKRLWDVYGKLSLWICAGSMAIIMTLLLWEATIVTKVDKAPSPELILGIPGINPVIPVGFGILGLVIAIVVHEFAHGIMTRVGDMKVQSLGLVFLVFPIGAFVEPDEEALKKTTRSRRSKVFAAGPASNIVIAMVVLGLFSGVMMSSVEPGTTGALARGVVEDSPAEIAGIAPNSVIIAVDHNPVLSGEELSSRTSSAPGSIVNISYAYKDENKEVSVVDGIVVSYVAEDFAAHEAGIRAGMVLVALNGTYLGNIDMISETMSDCNAGQTVPLVVMSYSNSLARFEVNSTITQITLSDKWEYYDEFNPSKNDDSYHGKAFLGGGFLYLGIDAADISYYSDILASPFEGDRNLDDFSRSWLRLIALPFLDLAPIRSPVTDLYTPSGYLEWMPESVFWLLANSFYWIFWLNLMVGLTNVLPAVPLDGGYIFRDGISYILDKTGRKYSDEQKERITGSVAISLALLVLFLIVWQLVGPSF